jgi:CSLREA domain-containing protein
MRPGDVTMKMRRIIISAAACALLPLALVVLGQGKTAALPGAGYGLFWWTVDGAGGKSGGGSYAVAGTIGQPDAGALGGGDHTLAGGFWPGAGAAVPTVPPTPGPALIVNATDDTDDGTCDVTHCSLREATRLAGVGDSVAFDIPPTDPGYDPLVGAWTIRPLTTYPLGEGVTLDGAAQTANRGDTNPLGPEIELDGSLVTGPSGWGFQLGTGDIVIRGLTMNRFREGAIRFFGQEATNIHFVGNYVGTDPTGSEDLGNGWGISIFWGAHENTVGGTAPEDRNLISGNDQGGIRLFGVGVDDNHVVGNFIGTTADGSGALGNTDAGILVISGAQKNFIGPGNVIAFNDGDGVRVHGSDSLSNTITGNAIHSNGGLGIDNVAGGNLELAPPVIGTATASGVSGTACGGCTIELFSDEEDEGHLYEGTAIADGGGNWTWAGSQTGPYVTATATDAAGNTSEFSAPQGMWQHRVYLPLVARQ